MAASIQTGLFISRESNDYFEKLPPKKRLMLREFIHQIQICEMIDTPEAKDALWETMVQWENARDKPHLSQLFELLDRYMEENVLLRGDLSRCYAQILYAL